MLTLLNKTAGYNPVCPRVAQDILNWGQKAQNVSHFLSCAVLHAVQSRMALQVQQQQGCHPAGLPLYAPSCECHFKCSLSQNITGKLVWERSQERWRKPGRYRETPQCCEEAREKPLLPNSMQPGQVTCVSVTKGLILTR